MSKYVKKSFSPHIYQDWIHLFRQCSPEQRSELLLAITDFPNHEPEIEISIWDFIKSQLDTQYQSMENKSQQMSTNRNNKKQKSTEVNQSRPMSTEVDQSSQIEIETGIETRIETEIKEKEISDDISKKKPIDFDTTFQAGGQLWVLPPNFRKLALTRYTESEIRAFEKTHSCHESLEDVCLNDIKHEPKPKATRFVKPTVEEIAAYCKERNNRVDIHKFYNHYESNGWKVGKNPMKDWKAAVRTWEMSEYLPNRKATDVQVDFSEITRLWNEMATRLKLDKIEESDLMPERKTEIEKIIAIKKPKGLKSMFDQLEKTILRSPKLLGRQDVLGSDGHWITKELNWKANFAFCFSTKGWSDIMGGKYNGEVE